MISNEHGPSNSMCIPEDLHPSFQILKCLCRCAWVGGGGGTHSHFPAWESHLAEVRPGWAWDGLLASFFDQYYFHQYSSVHGPPLMLPSNGRWVGGGPPGRSLLFWALAMINVGLSVLMKRVKFLTLNKCTIIVYLKLAQ